ncbi:metal ABC transporter ATP-binding protein [Gephyromycinifex aptenodytis]|uniref:metal ABC transporter ATP-binding protein n=1 Tax=Gephyromycinifex aptenodytis TaxID=2716227 RepID=UPI001D02E02D|nr:metal ABC transporter ATP-binding protein [Gephyromycinifex aptenodytis]
MISTRSAAFGYADRPVVKGIDLRVEAGERVALLGPNGSGKSTLVKGLLGLNDHLGGQVELFGTPLAQFRKRYLLGYVPQRHTLSASVAATVSEVVATGRLPHRRVLAAASAQDRKIIAASLDLVGLTTRARDEVSTLSGGQQRRVLIARALAAQPQMLIMDEPTAGVDAASQAGLAGVLQRLVHEGVSLLIVTHELAPLHGLFTRVVTMDSGRICADEAAESPRKDHP